jgi:hypothetical protein
MHRATHQLLLCRSLRIRSSTQPPKVCRESRCFRVLFQSRKCSALHQKCPLSRFCIVSFNVPPRTVRHLTQSGMLDAPRMLDWVRWRTVRGGTLKETIQKRERGHFWWRAEHLRLWNKTRKHLDSRHTFGGCVELRILRLRQRSSWCVALCILAQYSAARGSTLETLDTPLHLSPLPSFRNDCSSMLFYASLFPHAPQGGYRSHVFFWAVRKDEEMARNQISSSRVSSFQLFEY